MYLIARQFAFSASHQLTTLPDGHKCRRSHGHNYTVEIQLAADSLDKHGFVADFVELDPVGQWIDDHYDHQHLNDMIETPSSECLAAAIFEQCARILPAHISALISAVRVSESTSSWATYSPTRGSQ